MNFHLLEAMNPFPKFELKDIYEMFKQFILDQFFSPSYSFTIFIRK